MYAVILAGGGGTRLWPLSTPERPKPFLPLLGGRSLLQLTSDRLGDLIARGDVFVVTERRYAALVREQLPGITVVEEPFGRNTAAAVALAVAALDRPAEDVMAVLPADHLIGNEPGYRSVLRAAEHVAGGACGVADPLVTLGVQPSFAATGYGYLRPDPASGEVVSGLLAQRLQAFVEKPTQDDADALLSAGGVAWNAGIFVARRRVLRAAFAAHAPRILDRIERGLAAGDLHAAYAAVGAMSIDFAVMERAAEADEVVMVGMNVPWSDLGSWGALLEALGAPRVEGRVIAPGGRAVVAEADLLVRRRGGHLTVEPGPGTIADEPGPVALLEGAAAHGKVVAALVGRVAAGES